MSALDQLVENDLVSKTIYEAIALRPRKTARTGFVNICCPMCISRGETPDRRYRCGIKQGDGIGVNCYNCGFKGRWKIGELLSRNMRDFLGALGVSSRQVQIVANWVYEIRNMLATRPDVQAKYNVSVALEFPTIDLPKQARSLEDLADSGCEHPDYLATVSYLLSRGDVAVGATTYYWSPEPDFRKYLIIPCYHHKKLVGWNARSIDGSEPRYRKEVPSNFLFNADVLLNQDRKYVFIVEGIFDALVIDGLGSLGASLNDIQIAWIVQSGKQPVVIGDRDKAGDRLVEIALKHGWPVAPMIHATGGPKYQWWDSDIKDVADAVKRYGKLYTVQSILSNLTWNATQIRQRILYRVT